MPARGTSITVTYSAYSTSANGFLAGDVANHTLSLIRDGAASSPTNAPADAGGGEYSLALTADETTCEALTIRGTSTTAGAIIVPVKIAFDAPPVQRNVTVAP